MVTAVLIVTTQTVGQILVQNCIVQRLKLEKSALTVRIMMAMAAQIAKTLIVSMIRLGKAKFKPRALRQVRNALMASTMTKTAKR